MILNVMSPHKLSLSFRNSEHTFPKKKVLHYHDCPTFSYIMRKAKKFAEVIDADRPSFTFNTDKDRETSEGIQKVINVWVGQSGS